MHTLLKVGPAERVPIGTQRLWIAPDLKVELCLDPNNHHSVLSPKKNPLLFANHSQ